MAKYEKTEWESDKWRIETNSRPKEYSDRIIYTLMISALAFVFGVAICGMLSGEIRNTSRTYSVDMNKLERTVKVNEGGLSSK